MNSLARKQKVIDVGLMITSSNSLFRLYSSAIRQQRIVQSISLLCFQVILCGEVGHCWKTVYNADRS